MAYKSLKYAPAPIPDYEEARMLELLDLSILDTEPEARFEAITDLITSILDVPIALITLVDENRQWFKSACGISLKQTDRDISFCGYTILKESIFVVEDALNDSRFKNNPLVVEEPNIRFYAGAVLRGPKGMPIGSCCVIDSRPRNLTERDKKLLLKISKVIESLILYDDKIRTAQKKAVVQIHYDPLTRLPNKQLLVERAQRNVDSLGAGGLLNLYVIDICRFADLNSAKGSLIGDQVLKTIAERLRMLAGNSFTVARLESDKFAILAVNDPNNSKQQDDLNRLPIEVLSSLDKPVPLEGSSVHLETKIGIAVYPRDADNVNSLIDCATFCLKHSRNEDSTSIIYYSENVLGSSSRRYELEQSLRTTIGTDAFHLVYQPIVETCSGSIVSVEALLRWNPPGLGSVSPVEFIAIAEETGLIIPLGDWVLEEAFRQAKEWESLLEKKAFPITVNLSTVQLMQTQLAEKLTTLCREHALSPNLIQLEITESSILSDIDRALENMSRIANNGTTFLIDDFGTGYSSLSYLRRLPVSKIKLDRSFIIDVNDQNDSAILVKGIINICQKLGLDVVAEGVETKEHKQILSSFGCQLAQGFFFSKPLHADDLSKLFSERKFVFDSSS